MAQGACSVCTWTVRVAVVSLHAVAPSRKRPALIARSSLFVPVKQGVFCPDNVVILWRDKLSQTHFTECCEVSAVAYSMRLFMCIYQENKDQQWKRAMDYLSAISELNYMTQIVIMLYEDNNKVRDIAVGQNPSCRDARRSPREMSSAGKSVT